MSEEQAKYYVTMCEGITSNGDEYMEGSFIDGRNKESKDTFRIDRNTQIGGNHYSKMKIQPIEFVMANNLSFMQGNVIKYVCRYKDKGGIQDLEKAKQNIDFMIEELKNKVI